MESSTPSRDTAWAMSEENVELTLLLSDALNRRDVDAWVALWDDEGSWSPAIETLTEGRRTYRGPAEMRQYFSDLAGFADAAHIEWSEGYASETESCFGSAVHEVFQRRGPRRRGCRPRYLAQRNSGKLSRRDEPRRGPRRPRRGLCNRRPLLWTRSSSSALHGKQRSVDEILRGRCRRRTSSWFGTSSR